MSLRPPSPEPADTTLTDMARSGTVAFTLADADVVAHLLALAGPEGAAPLLSQIVADLDEVRTALTKAVAARDGVAIRRAAHVLVSLSGTIGALPTCAMARDLTGAGPSAGCDRLDDLAARLLADIDGLMAELASLAEGAGP